jgi:hypothetical protein
MISRLLLVPALALTLVAASATCGSSLTGPVPPGSWAGTHIGLVVSETGATIEYDCARGTIDQPLVAADGVFTTLGTHYRGHGGPVREGEAPDSHPARYDGKIDGNKMSLEVTLTDSGEKLGSFTLQRGASADLTRCL